MPSSSQLKKFVTQQAQYVNDPVKWAYDVLKFEADTWQAQALQDLVNRRFCAWSTGTGVGKSAILSVATLWFLSTRPFPRVPSTAPTEHQLNDILWAEHAKWLRRSELLSKMFKWTATKVALKGHEEEWYAVARTSRPKPGEQSAEGLQGFHSGNILFIVDEGSAVHDSIYNAMDGAFTTPDAYGIIASNPTRRTGYFFRILSDPRQQEMWALRIVDARTAKMVDKASIERIKKVYGEDSDYWRMKVMGLPPAIDASSLVSDEQVAEAHLRELGEEANAQTVMSCDPARFGDDYTVFFVRKGSKIIDRQCVKGMDTTQVTKIGKDLFDLYQPDAYLIDVIGVGAGVVDQSRALLGSKKGRVIEVNVGEKAYDEEKYVNKKAEMFWHLRTRIDSISIPFDTPLLDEELPVIKYMWDAGDTRIKIEKKEEVKRRLGRSPNDADSLALCFYNEVVHKQAHCSPSYFKVGEQVIDQTVHPDQGFDVTAQSRSVVGARRYSEFRSTRLSQFH